MKKYNLYFNSFLQLLMSLIYPLNDSEVNDCTWYTEGRLTNSLQGHCYFFPEVSQNTIGINLMNRLNKSHEAALLVPSSFVVYFTHVQNGNLSYAAITVVYSIQYFFAINVCALAVAKYILNWNHIWGCNLEYVWKCVVTVPHLFLCVCVCVCPSVCHFLS